MLTAVITGAAGQDGSYLSEHLIHKGYRVIGVTRRHSTSEEYKNINHLLCHENFKLIEGDITESLLQHLISMLERL